MPISQCQGSEQGSSCRLVFLTHQQESLAEFLSESLHPDPQGGCVHSRQRGAVRGYVICQRSAGSQESL